MMKCCLKKILSNLPELLLGAGILLAYLTAASSDGGATLGEIGVPYMVSLVLLGLSEYLRRKRKKDE